MLFQRSCNKIKLVHKKRKNPEEHHNKVDIGWNVLIYRQFVNFHYEERQQVLETNGINNNQTVF